MLVRRKLACSLVLPLVLLWTTAAVGAPETQPDVREGVPTSSDASTSPEGDAAVAVPEEPPVPCAPDATGAVIAVREIFSGLAGLYRDRLPGPAGEAYLQTRSEKLIHTLADESAFSEAILRGLKEEMTPGQDDAWVEMFGALLRQRIRRRMQDPRGHTLAIEEASVSCHRAQVKLALRSNSGKRGGGGGG